MVILRDALSDLLYPDILFLTSVWKSSPQVISLYQQTLYFPSLSVDSEAWGAQGSWVLVLTPSSLESLLCLLVEAFFPFGTKTSRA